MPRDLILALDQGTTSTRSIAFRAPQLAPAATARRDLPQHFPASGWVEHDAEDIFAHSVHTLREALEQAGGSAADVAAIGITNQRETTLVWDRATGKPLHKAIVWQDRRTAPACAALREAGHEPLITMRTGLLLDPYFSATKLAWVLDNTDGARDAARAGRLAFGTIDTWLLWRLTGGRVHATDATNASRTMLYDITTGAWDPELLDLFRIPPSLLPEVRDSSGLFGNADPDILGAEVPVMGIAGDQQAATVGQACFSPGMVKSTYGTGCFLLLHTGDTAVASRTRMLTTVALQLAGKRTYALEGAIFVAGAAVQWLRDGLGVIGDAAEAGALAARADVQHPVYLVPAFVGLGAPHWNAEARGALFGLNSRHRRRRTRPRGAGKRRLPDPRPDRGHARRLVRQRRHRAAGGRRHGGERLDHAVPGRHAGRPRRPAGGAGNHRPGCCLSRRQRRRRLPGSAGIFPVLGAAAALCAAHGRTRAHPPLCRLAGRGPPHSARRRR